MPTIQTWEQARHTRTAVRKDTFQGHITDFIATHAARRPGAQAFLVEQDPDWVTPTHYHDEHQFQVVIAGQGSIGRRPVGPLSVHYAAPETGYGPITAGSAGVSYLTLRPSGDTGAWYIHKPGSRERMQPGLKREQQHAAQPDSVDAADLAGLPDVSQQALVPARADGLAAHLVRMGPGQCHVPTSAHAHGGRFYVVTHGSVALDGIVAPHLAVAFVGLDAQSTLVAGPAGAEMLVLQFPVQALAGPLS